MEKIYKKQREIDSGKRQRVMRINVCFKFMPAHSRVAYCATPASSHYEQQQQVCVCVRRIPQPVLSYWTEQAECKAGQTISNCRHRQLKYLLLNVTENRCQSSRRQLSSVSDMQWCDSLTNQQHQTELWRWDTNTATAELEHQLSHPLDPTVIPSVLTTTLQDNTYSVSVQHASTLRNIWSLHVITINTKTVTVLCSHNNISSFYFQNNNSRQRHLALHFWQN